MKFLITNDDGIYAPGIAALLQAAMPLGETVVVAPLEHQSGCSHQVTTNGAIRIEKRADDHFAVSGTPADCVRVALHRLVPDTAWVLSGINEGGNLGADVWHSGTVAAVREAVLHGWSGIAISQYRKRGKAADWQRAAAWTRQVLQQLFARPQKRGAFWNVNLPYLESGQSDPDVVFCPLDSTPLPLSFREDEEGLVYDGDYHQRRRDPGADVEVCFNGNIAVTQIALF
jgi:5'-nucleotidase